MASARRAPASQLLAAGPSASFSPAFPTARSFRFGAVRRRTSRRPDPQRRGDMSPMLAQIRACATSGPTAVTTPAQQKTGRKMVNPTPTRHVSGLTGKPRSSASRLLKVGPTNGTRHGSRRHFFATRPDRLARRPKVKGDQAKSPLTARTSKRVSRQASAMLLGVTLTR